MYLQAYCSRGNRVHNAKKYRSNSRIIESFYLASDWVKKYLVFTGRPDTPQNCTILNQTTNSLYVECTEGFDGGLPQRFTLELEMDDSTNTLEARGLVHNRTNKEASFGVHGLTPGSTYHATIYASNAKGRSEAVRLRAATLNLPERRTGKNEREKLAN